MGRPKFSMGGRFVKLSLPARGFSDSTVDCEIRLDYSGRVCDLERRFAGKWASAQLASSPPPALGAPRAGEERRHFGAGPLSSSPPLPGHRPSQNSLGGFHNLQCCQRIHERGRESLTDLPPQGKFWPPHHSPARPPQLSPYLAPILEFLYIYDACGIWKTTGEVTRRHLMQ